MPISRGVASGADKGLPGATVRLNWACRNIFWACRIFSGPAGRLCRPIGYAYAYITELDGTVPGNKMSNFQNKCGSGNLNA